MAKIGFIGVGNMGRPMATRLAQAGHGVLVFDVSTEAMDRMAGARVQQARSVQDAARGVDVVVTMLPAGSHVRSVYLGPRGILAAADPDTLFIDSSTIDVETARAVAADATAAGFAMLDAPVSGGVGGAEAGTLTFMCGGPAEAFTRARPILEAMGRTIVHAGAPGAGQAAKICNNMILGTTMIVVGEAFALAEKLGLDAQKLFEISSKSSGQCWALTSYCPVPGPVPTSPANRGYKAGFTTAMMLKDLRLAQEAAHQVGAVTPIGAAAAALYALREYAGFGPEDFSGIIQMLRRQS
jgi:3-hydroxyisobutyrate dehydrogenase